MSGYACLWGLLWGELGRSWAMRHPEYLSRGGADEHVTPITRGLGATPPALLSF